MSLMVKNTTNDYSYCLRRTNCYECKNKSKCEKDDYIFELKARRVGAEAISKIIKLIVEYEKELNEIKQTISSLTGSYVLDGIKSIELLEKIVNDLREIIDEKEKER